LGLLKCEGLLCHELELDREFLPTGLVVLGQALEVADQLLVVFVLEELVYLGVVLLLEFLRDQNVYIASDEFLAELAEDAGEVVVAVFDDGVLVNDAGRNHVRIDFHEQLPLELLEVFVRRIFLFFLLGGFLLLLLDRGGYRVEGGFWVDVVDRHRLEGRLGLLLNLWLQVVLLNRVGVIVKVCLLI